MVKTLRWTAVILITTLVSAGAAALTPLPLRQISIHDGFWGPKLEVYRQRTIPHSWNYMGSELRALQKANGKDVQGELNGTWGEANLYKFLETIGHSLSMHPDVQLEQRVDEIVGLLAGAQQPDGYLHAFITNSKKLPWDPEFLDGSHDGYVLGHLIEAALAYSEATGKQQFLDLAEKAANQAWNHFLGPQGRPGFCGHAELEMALVELYRVRPNPRYLALAKAFVEWRGRGKVKPFSETPRAYFQDGSPLRQQRTLDGHAVRAMFFATGVADLALVTGDIDYRLAANRFWDSTTRRRMNIAGGTGPRKEHEAFGEDYELPNDGYYESCAACALADFSLRMFLLERKAEAIDVLERVLYNAVLHGISLDGTSSYYMNPLTDRDNPRYNSWVCCPPNLSRTLMQLGRYAFASEGSDLYLNLYVSGECTIPCSGEPTRLRVETEYPWDSKVRVTVRPGGTKHFTLRLRWPGWAESASLLLNGTLIKLLPKDDNGYLVLERDWGEQDVLELQFAMPVMRMEAHPNIRDCAGRVALQLGPIVYAFEGLDNRGTADVELAADPQFRVEHRKDFLGGITVIHCQGAKGEPLLAVPFYALANRAKSSQAVWVRQAGFEASTGWWLGELYRPYE